jgi:hypothetical protein
LRWSSSAPFFGHTQSEVAVNRPVLVLRDIAGSLEEAKGAQGVITYSAVTHEGFRRTRRV